MTTDKLPRPQNEAVRSGYDTALAALGSLALQQLHTGVVVVDLDGRCAYANAMLQDMLGHAGGDLAGRYLHELVHTQGPPGAVCDQENCPLLQALSQPFGRHAEFETVFMRPDGAAFIVVCKARTLVHGKDHFIAFEVQDVTHERQAKLLSRTKELEYQFAANAAKVGSWIRDFHTDSVTVCEVMAQLLELPAGQTILSDTQWRALIFADDLPDVERQVAACIAGGGTLDLEYRVLLPGGRLRWLSSRGTVVRDGAGTPLSLTGMSIDITERKELEEAIRASEERFRRLAEMSPTGIYVVVDGRYVYTNQAAVDMLGGGGDQSIIGRSPWSFIDAAYHERAAANLQQALHEGRSPMMEFLLHRLDGAEVWVQASAGLVTWAGQPATQIVARDITEEKRTRETLRVMSERVNLALASAGEAVWDWDIPSDTMRCSGGLKTLVEWSDAFSPNSLDAWAAIVHPDDLPSLQYRARQCMDGATPTYECEFRLRMPDGAWRWMVTRGVVVARDENGAPLSLTGTLTDISARKESDELAWRHANLDPLTGLPNRRLYHERLEVELQRAQRTGKPLALLFIDLDRFKQVNDLHGHGAGDQLLVDAARRIQRCVRKTDSVARMGGDEFTVLLADLEGLGHVDFVCQKIIESLMRPFPIGEDLAYISCSIGVALYPTDAATAEDLMRKADQAMYAAKESGREQFKYFTRTMDETAHRRLTLTNELRHAIGKGQMSVHYQPVLRLSDRQVVKAEALARWQHPSLGNIQPSEFIPLAEEAGMIGNIGDWVLEQAVHQSSRWTDRTGEAIQVGVNQSPLEFAIRNTRPGRVRPLEESGLAGSNVSIEITESILLHESPGVTETLLRYRDAGIQVAIDDFGTGCSSLAYLQQFDIDYLKIDRSFVHDIGSNDANRTIVETVIMMAHKLGLQVIAEGIETPEQMTCLTEAGCDYGQGFLFSPAVPAREFERILADGLGHEGMPLH